MTKHTATPWVFSEDRTMIYTSGNAPFGYKVIKPNNDSREDEATANTAFIVRAVNSHEALVDALKRISNGEFSPDLPNGECLLAMRNVARKALKQAEGE